MEGLIPRKDDGHASTKEVPAGVAGASFGHRVGVNPDTLRGWFKQIVIDVGQRPGTTTDEARRIREFEFENRELKRANEILLAASSFFARESGPRLPW